MANPIGNAKTYAKITGIALGAIALLGIVLSSIGDEGRYGFFCSGTVNGQNVPDASKTTCEGEATGMEETAGGVTVKATSFLAFDWTHNVLHVVLAAVALYVGFGPVGAAMTTNYARYFGIVYLALGVLGFFVPALGPLHLELGENVIHLLIGGWGAYAGFFGTTMSTPTTGTRPATTMGTPPARK